jgi:hypothetical protein
MIIKMSRFCWTHASFLLYVTIDSRNCRESIDLNKVQEIGAITEVNSALSMECRYSFPAPSSGRRFDSRAIITRGYFGAVGYLASIQSSQPLFGFLPLR